MKYESIKKMIEEYGEDYLSEGDADKILNIIKDSPTMQEQFRKGLTKEWLDLLAQRKKVYVYTDYRKGSSIKDNVQYPFLELTIQDELLPGKPGKERGKISTPVVRYVCQKEKALPSMHDFAKDTENRLKRKAFNEEK